MFSYSSVKYWTCWFFVAVLVTGLGCRRGQPVAEVRPVVAISGDAARSRRKRQSSRTTMTFPGGGERRERGSLKAAAPTEWSPTKNVVWSVSFPERGTPRRSCGATKSSSPQPTTRTRRCRCLAIAAPTAHCVGPASSMKGASCIRTAKTRRLRPRRLAMGSTFIGPPWSRMRFGCLPSRSTAKSPGKPRLGPLFRCMATGRRRRFIGIW